MTAFAIVGLLGCSSPVVAKGSHASDAQALRDAVVARDLDGVVRSANRLRRALPEDPGLGEGLRAIAAARDTTMAGQALGQLLPRCAACHTEAGTPAPPRRDVKVGRDTVAEAMKAHANGAHELWNGLLFGDLDRLKRGAATIAGANLVPTGTPVGSQVSPLASEQAVQVQDLADRVARSDTLPSAADAYGRMLARCAACHAVTDGGPKR